MDMPPDAERPHAGPSFHKSSPELVEQFGAVMSGIPGVERRQMFGYPAAFANGYMVTGLHQANWVVRLPPDALDVYSEELNARVREQLDDPTRSVTRRPQLTRPLAPEPPGLGIEL